MRGVGGDHVQGIVSFAESRSCKNPSLKQMLLHGHMFVHGRGVLQKPWQSTLVLLKYNG